jgi:hypothetical protein
MFPDGYLARRVPVICHDASGRRPLGDLRRLHGCEAFAGTIRDWGVREAASRVKFLW